MNTKKYIAEFIGTFTLTLFGCGSAALSGGIDGKLGILGISMAFGLSIVAMAYAIGDISGCHINPAVSLAMLISKKMDVKDFVGYVVAQVLGGIAAAGVLSFIINSSSNLGSVAEVGLGQNGFGSASYVGLSMGGAIVVEIILTFVFLMTILGVTAKAKTQRKPGQKLRTRSSLRLTGTFSGMGIYRSSACRRCTCCSSLECSMQDRRLNLFHPLHKK